MYADVKLWSVFVWFGEVAACLCFFGALGTEWWVEQEGQLPKRIGGNQLANPADGPLLFFSPLCSC